MPSLTAEPNPLRPLIECVPNFSEGRDARKVQAIVQAILDGPEVFLLDQTSDPDHNRSVVTFVATEPSAAEAALRGIGRAAELIDMNAHRGVHPRIGAADVVPFIPLLGARMETCVGIARRVAGETARRFGIPAYLYDEAAFRPDRRQLEMVRRGQFEELRERIQTDPGRLPDFGEPRLHPTAGAAAIGARDLLIAFNINLTSPEVSLARLIARKIRASTGGLPSIKALGLYLPSRNLAQVSINLTDFKITPLATIFEAVRRESAALGTGILETEIIGLVPRAAVKESDTAGCNITNFRADLVLENRLAAVVPLKA